MEGKGRTGPTVEWPVGVGAKGNGGVAALVDLMPGAIGYLDHASAMQGKGPISFALVQNKAGKFVRPGVESFAAAASSVEWVDAEDFSVILTDACGDQAYPITATVFALMRRQPRSPARAAVARNFLKWVLENGQAQAEALDYMPLPPALVQEIKAYWQAQFVERKG